MFQNLTGNEYLMAEIACKHDKTYEKATWDERIAHCMDLFKDPSNISKKIKKASNPIGMRAALNAWNATAEDKASGYMISLDACSSGLQILSLLVSCPKSFSLCGGVSDRCVDSYVSIYDSMGLHGVLTRKQVKQAIMTSLYGSTATPEHTFGANVDMFYETMEDMAPGAWDLNIGLQELWDQVSGSVYEWVMPDNFHACIETKDKELVPFKFLDTDYSVPVKIDARPDFHKGLGPNLIHSVDGMVVREMFRRCMFNPATTQRVLKAIHSANHGTDGKSSSIVTELWNNFLQTGFLSVRILDHLYEDTMGLVSSTTILELISSLPDKPFELVSVHD